MTELVNQHPKTENEAEAAAFAFERKGEETVSLTDTARNESIQQLQDFMKDMTTDERKEFFAHYPDMQQGNLSAFPGQRNIDLPAGYVEKDSSGRPSGIKFTDSGISTDVRILFGRPANEFEIKP